MEITRKIVCWKCKRGNITLKKVGSCDYMCSRCIFEVGEKEPDIANQSFIKIENNPMTTKIKSAEPENPPIRKGAW